MAKVSQGANNRILAATLELSDGRTIEIPIGESGESNDDFTVDEGEVAPEETKEPEAVGTP